MNNIYFKSVESDDFELKSVENNKEIVDLLVSDSKDITKICLETNLYVFYNFASVNKTNGITGYIKNVDGDYEFFIGDFVLVRSIDDDTLGSVTEDDLEFLKTCIKT